ncbi:MAG: hypothetical protein MUD01_25630 [Chloroflexaceae bacterium]|jgi:hypothetical protein|nr:hypothetical protein [Chloroflexaceae bacterium]
MLTITNITGDFVLYRDLQPDSPHLPGLRHVRDALGFAPGYIPRKRDADYARAVLAMVRLAQHNAGQPPPQAFLVLGDTDNDRWMAQHLTMVSGLPALAFIAQDKPDEAPATQWDGPIAHANRWALLEPWVREVQGRGLPLAQTVLFLDIDKTLLGPRGRADGGIDDARADGALAVGRDILGSGFELPVFRQEYDLLCGKQYHGLTLDNQDYVVYLTLLLASGALTLERLHAGMADGSMGSFRQVLGWVEAERMVALPPALAALHREIRAADAAGDPTPFKAFRRAEFAATVGRMADGRLPLCREVVTAAQTLAGLGAHCVAASDKPAEAAYPSPAQAAAGLLPLHRTPAALG